MSSLLTRPQREEHQESGVGGGGGVAAHLRSHVTPALFRTVANGGFFGVWLQLQVPGGHSWTKGLLLLLLLLRALTRHRR